MNTSNTIFPNIGNRNKACHDSCNDDAYRMSLRVSTVTSETAQQKDPSIIPQNSCFGTEHNEIHSNPHKRKVDLKGAETYLTQPDRNGVVFHESIGNINNNTENLSGSRGFPSCRETVKGFFTSLVPQMKEGCKAFAWDPKPKDFVASMLNVYAPKVSLMGRFFIGFYALVCSATVTEARSEVKTTYSPDKVKRSNNAIGINDIKMLEKIGRHKDFPPDGNYELTANLDATNFKNPIKTFAGDFNGKNHTISNLPCSLILKIKDGTIRNLIISNANIQGREGCFSTLVCLVVGDSKISHSQFKDSQIQNKNSYDYEQASIVAGELMDSAKIENVSVKNCTIEIYKAPAWVGCLSGIARGESKSSNNTVDGCYFTIHQSYSSTGFLMGAMFDESMSSNDKVNNCRVVTHGAHSDTGGAVGYLDLDAKIMHVIVSESRVKGLGEEVDVGIVLGKAVNIFFGKKASISDSVAINSKATGTHESAKVGIWVGSSSKNFRLHNNRDSNCTIEFTGPSERNTTANVTTTELEPVIVDGASYLPLGLLFAGTTVASIGVTACFAYSIYNGYQKGKRGRSLVMHPFVSFEKFLHNCCKSVGGLRGGINQAEDEMMLINPMASLMEQFKDKTA